MIILWIAIALSVGALLGFLLCAILVVGSNSDTYAPTNRKDEDA